MKKSAQVEKKATSQGISNEVDPSKKKPDKISPFGLSDNRPQTTMLRKLFDEANNSKKNRTGLPEKLKAGIERLSGYSMDNVKVHYQSMKPEQLQAHAYTNGNDIHVAPGQEKHLPHEAWHIVQQYDGRVKPTAKINDVAINDDTDLEREATVMGSKALEQPSYPVQQTDAPQRMLSGAGVSQLKRIDKEHLERNPKVAQRLLEWIVQMKDLILGRKYVEAYQQLTNSRSVTKQFLVGLKLEDKLKILGPGQVAPPLNFYHANYNQIVLQITPTVIVPGKPLNCIPDWLADETIASIVLPTYLEEYMHYYQALTNTFLSESTDTFKQESGLKDKSEDINTGGADYDEVDILAKLMEWGFDVEKIDYIQRYAERVRYWEWRRQSNTN